MSSPEYAGRGRPCTFAPLTDEERDRIDAEAMAVARAIARAFARRWPWLADEFESAAMASLVGAAQTWRPGSAPFAWWAGRATRWACRVAVRRGRLRGYRQSARRAPLTLSMSRQATPSGDLPGDAPFDVPNRPPGCADRLAALWDETDHLRAGWPPRRSEWLRLVAVCGLRFDEVAAVAGVSKSLVSKELARVPNSDAFCALRSYRGRVGKGAGRW